MTATTTLTDTNGAAWSLRLVGPLETYGIEHLIADGPLVEFYAGDDADDPDALVGRRDLADVKAAAVLWFGIGRDAVSIGGDALADVKAWLVGVVYDDQCRYAATRQGLDPLADALRAAGVEFNIEQTGGFTMVLTARTALGVFTMTDDGAIVVGLSTAREWYDVGGDSIRDWTVSPEGFARFATLIATMQAAVPMPDADTVESTGLDGTNRQDVAGAPYDWVSVLDAAHIEENHTA